MATSVRCVSPFAETKKPPPPVVLLLLQTALDVHTSTGLVVHEDLENHLPSAKKMVMLAPTSALEHTYPPPPIIEVPIPAPRMLTHKIIENHADWKVEAQETALIKTTIHQLVDRLLDTTKALSDQKDDLLQQVFKEAAVMHPVLRNYNSDWVTRCIVQARLKATAASASAWANKTTVAEMDNVVKKWHTRSSSKFEIVAMDVDPDPPNDNGDHGGNRRIQELSPSKVRVVTGLQHEAYENISRAFTE
ncbi:hypothetical protein DFH07DRAFT_951809 [Mycena maculata]|uniref:Uncharacterized protein n=1 Tax=Mycena maculata TaxID=230809 RepID=A0AAD7K0S6_9AGAR|nr:hypothetical protein DFH07DRAFT_951809 [Mycena maculata]